MLAFQPHRYTRTRDCFEDFVKVIGAADVVLLSESTASFAAADREQFYVSVSRGRKGARVYTDSKQELAEAVGKSKPRLSATELVRDSNRMLRIKLAVATKLRSTNHEPTRQNTPVQEVAYG